MTGLELLIKQADEKAEQLKEALATGSAKDYEEYRAICGEIKGLLTARMYLTDLETKIEELDE